jgi:hypothetical protein
MPSEAKKMAFEVRAEEVAARSAAPTAAGVIPVPNRNPRARIRLKIFLLIDGLL